MTTVEHTHTEFATKEEVADHKVAIADAILSLTQSQIKADERMARIESEMREMRSMIQDLIDSTRALTETNRRAIGFATSENE